MQYVSWVQEIGIEDLSAEDNIVALFGPTGAGKSTFIEMATGITGIAGHELDGANVCLVDTPGFNDTHKSDHDTWKPLSEWLIKIYKRTLQLKGLLYFHRISDNRIDGTSLKNVRYFEELCGTELHKVILTTTMWDSVDEDTGARREDLLRLIHWQSMIRRGSSIRRFKGDRGSALEILKPIVGRTKKNLSRMVSLTTELNATAISATDNIVVLMGPTGSGKSSFIDIVTGTAGRAGHGLQSCTSKISVVKLSFLELSDWDICLVDTPGFDDTNRSDADIFEMISDWLNDTYKKQVQLAGLLYFHRISDNRMAGNALKNIRVFEKLCGKNFNNIVLATTMWDKEDKSIGTTRERELIDKYWQPMVARGSTVARFLHDRESAFRVLAPILDELNKRNVLLLQKEISDLGLKLNQTTAGRTLFSELERLVPYHQKTLEEIRMELKTEPLNEQQLQQRMDDYQKVSAQLTQALEDMYRMKISAGDRLQRLIKVKNWKFPIGILQGMKSKTGRGDQRITVGS